MTMYIALQALDSVDGVPTDCGADCGPHRLDGLALHTSYDMLKCDVVSRCWCLMLCHWPAAVKNNCKPIRAKPMCLADNAIQ